MFFYYIMDLSFLTILNILILFFILKHQKKNCIPCRYFFVVTLVVILGLYELYMCLSYPKIQEKNNKVNNIDTNLNLPVSQDRII